MSVQILTQENFDDFIRDGDTLVDFWATWCGPCRMQAPLVEQFADANPAVKVGKVDTDANPALAMRFDIMSIPTLIAFRNGQVLNMTVGVTPAQGLEELFK